MNSKLRFPIPSDILENTIEYSRELSLRLQIEAAALAGLDSPQAKALAQERLEPKRKKEHRRACQRPHFKAVL